MKIKILKDEVVYDGHYLKTIIRSYRGRTGQRKEWEMVKRKSFRKIVAIAPITDHHEIIFTKTYRIPLKKYIIELCAGLTDKKGEFEIQTAKRELLEETGYKVSKIRRFITGPYSSGLVDTQMTIYLGFGAKKASRPKLEESEDITTIKIPLRKAYSYLTKPPKNTLVDIKIFSVLLAFGILGYQVQ
ncbi:MAG: NUDIX hydrolase [Candidatus Liptonbacteria bacterium]|nr:NUDIX hydrolase [Candidatus Liptonbacteria bacterium]